MKKTLRSWDDLYSSQKGLTWKDCRSGKVAEGIFQSRVKLVREYAKHLAAQDQEISHAKVRDMLEGLGRGYTLNRWQITFALKNLRKDKRIKFRTTGTTVQIDGRTYPSIRQAAKSLGLGVETVRRRIIAKTPDWAVLD